MVRMTREEEIRELWESDGDRMFANGEPVWNHPRKIRIMPFKRQDVTLPHSDSYFTFRRGVEFHEFEPVKRYFVECEGIRVAEHICAV